MSPITRGGLQLRAGVDGDVAALPFSFLDFDPQLADPDPPSSSGIVLLSLEVSPQFGLVDLFHVVLLDEDGLDVLSGCGRSRHPRRATRCMIRNEDDEHPILDAQAERFTLKLSGVHSPGATVGITLTYAAGRAQGIH